LSVIVVAVLLLPHNTFRDLVHASYVPHSWPMIQLGFLAIRLFSFSIFNIIAVSHLGTVPPKDLCADAGCRTFPLYILTSHG
jgi:hypothetical protein